ncbi:RHS repeat domain-containing protein [Akkermansia muciniphila]|uniref:RHS repeat domain-containing protein n=4 Tax=Akkermansia muciniphila TaxID=239935 RepID=UPI0013E8D835|nr:RHS repeat-associated core domain-containing protein [Akkermansia muciniphila]
MSKHSSCLIHRNFLVGISYSDATPGQSFAYNHLGQLTQITDASGTRTFAYNPYGEPETDCLEANGISWQVSELYDGLGRQAGYELSADGRRVQQARLSYDGKGRLSALAAEGMETPFSWTYCEQGGLVEQLAYPNGMTRVNTYENSRDLLSVIDYRRPGSANPPARHEYDYDALGRPTRRRDTWNTAAPKTTRLFTYNSRGELVGDQLRPGGRFGYQYDNIGNRKEAFEFGNTTDYETDELNRYAGIAGNGAAAFVPQYDADGNQTLVKTSTGIWTVTYNAENRPVKFESEDGGTTVECAYDSMGRRFEKKVTVGGTTGFHARYLYRDYLQVAECDLTGETPKLVRSYLWDPSEPEATRVLAMTRWEANGTQVKEHLYCMHDAMKNVTSLFGEARGRRALYEYRPYGGLVTSEGNMAQENKFRFSCEYMDDELGLIYYNYRHLNPHDGRWISRDPIKEEGGWNLFAFVGNSPIHVNDNKGLSEDEICNVINKNNKTIDEVRAGFDPILQKIGDLIHIWDLLKKFNSNPANHKGEKITVILKNSDLIIESGRNSFFLIRTPLKDCVRKLCFSRRGFGGSRNKGERNLAGSPAGTPNEFKKMKPDPNNPDRVLMKDPNGKTISKPKPNGFDEFWKNKHN